MCAILHRLYSQKAYGALLIQRVLLAWWDYIEPLRLSIALWRAGLLVIPDQFSIPMPSHLPQMACIHDMMHRHEPHFPEVGAPEVIAAREESFSLLAKRCRAILVDSSVGKRHVLNAYHPASENVFVLPFTICQELINATPQKPAGVPQALAHRYLLYPAQLWQHKNHVGLIEAIARLVPRLNIHCVFTGGSEKNGYEPLLAAVDRHKLQDRVHLLGYVSDHELAWLYTNARCMAMPTFFGPTNIPPLEAMHFACPVAVSDIYAMREQLGDAALYFDPADPDSMANSIEKLWTDEDLRRELGRKGLAVASRHTPAAFSARLREIINTILP